MPGMRELKNHLRSVNTTGQLAGAMKTVSSAKFSRVNAVYAAYAKYAAACDDIISSFGEALADALPCTSPDAPELVVVVASNRGLCGGFNSTLLAYADECFEEYKHSGHEYCVVACGKIAAAYFTEHGVKTERDFVFPDIPAFDDCREFCEYLRNGFVNGEFSAVSFVYQHFKNMLTQIPTKKQLLPLGNSSVSSSASTDDVIYIPDRETVMKNACLSCVDCSIYSSVLDAATGAQAATMMAMREATDNVKDTIAALELEISRKRQSEVTSSVIETYSPEEEN